MLYFVPNFLKYRVGLCGCTTARDLMSVRAMIAELEAEAEALTDKLKGVMVERGEEILQGRPR